MALLVSPFPWLLVSGARYEIRRIPAEIQKNKGPFPQPGPAPKDWSPHTWTHSAPDCRGSKKVLLSSSLSNQWGSQPIWASRPWPAQDHLGHVPDLPLSAPSLGALLLQANRKMGPFSYSLSPWGRGRTYPGEVTGGRKKADPGSDMVHCSSVPSEFTCKIQTQKYWECWDDGHWLTAQGRRLLSAGSRIAGCLSIEQNLLVKGNTYA